MVAADTWFAARLLLRSRLDGVEVTDALYEERIVLLQANSHEEAMAAARRYGLRVAHEYRNEAGELVSWELFGVDEVTEVLEPPNGTGWEVMSRFFRKDELPAVRLNQEEG